VSRFHDETFVQIAPDSKTSGATRVSSTLPFGTTQYFSSIFQVPLVHPWTTMDANGIVLRLKIGI
jgi:hypothetical protein